MDAIVVGADLFATKHIARSEMTWRVHPIEAAYDELKMAVRLSH